MEGVKTFNYLGRPLDQTDDYWMAVIGNFKWAQKVWRRLGKLLIREVEDPKVAEMFYRAVTQAVLLFGSKT